MLFTQFQIQELLHTLDYYQTWFIISNIGPQVLSDDELRILRLSGIDPFTFEHQNYIETAFKWGLLSQALGHDLSEKMSYFQFKQFLSSGQFLPHTEREKQTIHTLEKKTYEYIKNLGDKQKSEIKQQILHQELLEGVKRGLSKQQIVSNLGHKIGDWNKDWGRIVETELQGAFNYGRAATIEKDKGDDALVYKDVFPGACKHCIKLYLTEGIGSEPIIFKLKNLKANGTNIGRKQNEWKAVIEFTHPYCRCLLNDVPEGYTWNKLTRTFDIPGEYIPKVQRKSKVKVTIGNKEYLL